VGSVDPAGFARSLQEFDGTLAAILDQLTNDDILILTADHGNDPTSPSTDHSREYVPVCVVGKSITSAPVGDVEGMMAVGVTVAEHLGVDWKTGQSLLG
jgi:phosphopentomutase